MRISGKRTSRLLLAACLLFGSVAPPPALPVREAAAASTVTQGESVQSGNSNFLIGSSPATASTEASQTVWRLDTATEAPQGGYYATYTVTAAAAGLYRLEAVTSQLGSTATSPYAIEVNGSTQFASGSSRYESIGQTFGTTLYKTNFPVVRLNAGDNAITFRIADKRSGGNDKYVFFLDHFTLTDTEAGRIAASPVAGAVSAGTAVKLSAPYAFGADIYYTTDGSDPVTSPTRALYNEPISVSASTTIKSYASLHGVNGPETTHSYTVAEGTAVTVEAESPISSNFYTGASYPSYATTYPAAWTAATTTAAFASGGKIWRVETPRTLPADGYVAEYQVTVPQAGSYMLDMTTTPLDVTWASASFKLSVNGGAYAVVDKDAVQKGTAVGTQMFKYSYKPLVQLQAGVNTFKVMVDTRRASDTSYVVYFDSFTFRSISVGAVAASPQPSAALRFDTPVTLSVTPASSTIYYTTDGTDPRSSGSRLTYTAAIAVDRAMTIRTYAELGGAMGPLAEFTYTPAAELVSASPISGAQDPVTAGTTVTLSTLTPGATIYYTTDKSDPRTSNTRSTYSAPVAINGPVTIRAAAYRNGAYSAVKDYAYTVTSVPVIIVEGESTADTNMLVGASGLPREDRATASGGRILKLETQVAPPAEGYYAAYQVNVPEAGLYQLDAFITPPESIWNSPYSVVVGSEPEVVITRSNRYDGLDDRINRQHIGVFNLPAGTVPITFKVSSPRSQAPDAWTVYLDQFRLTQTTLQFDGLYGDEKLNVFEAIPGSPVEFEVRLNGPADQTYSYTYAVVDFYGQTVASGSGQIEAGAKKADIGLGELPLGHYTITLQLPGFNRTVTDYLAVVQQQSQRNAYGDSPFAIDTASNWYLPASVEKSAFARAMALSGTIWLRERFGWGVVQTASGTSIAKGASSWAPHNETINTLSASGLKLLHTLMDAPPWTRRQLEGGGSTTDKLALDLFAVYNFAKASAENYGSRVAAWEIWNEEEAFLTGNDESADQYAAYMKAASIGYKSANLPEEEMPYVSMGGFIRDLTDRFPYGDYQQLALQNDILLYSDIYNFHNHQLGYQPDNRLTPLMGEFTTMHLEQRDQYDTQMTPGWTTESGLGIRIPDKTEMNATQMGDQARFLVTSAVEDLALGSDKHFFFMGPSINENGVNWGMLSWSGTPRAAYSAQSTITEALGEAKYKGTLNALPANTKGYAFGDRGDTVLVLWSPEDTAVTLPLGKATGERTDIMGRTQTLTSEGGTFALTVGYNPVYLRVSGDIPAGVYDAVTHPERPLVKKSLNDAQKVVLAPNFSDEARSNAKINKAYTLKPGLDNHIKLDVYNFNETAMSGLISATVPAESGLAVSAAQPVTLQPGTKMTLTFTVAFAGGAEINSEIAPLTFQGSFDGEPTSRAVSPIRMADPTSAVAIIDAQGNPAVELTVTNPNAAVSTIDRIDMTLLGTTRTYDQLQTTVAAGASTTITLGPLPAVEWYKTYPVTYKVYFDNGSSIQVEQTFVLNPVLKHTVTVDGIPDTSPGALPITLALYGDLQKTGVDTYYGGESDLGGAIGFHWDDQNLYVSARITDDTFFQPHSGSEIWQADALQFAIASGPAGPKQMWYELGAALTPSGPQVWKWRDYNGGAAGELTSATAAIVRNETDKTTVYEIAIPWSALPPFTAGQRVDSISFSAIDNDGEQRKVWYDWGAGIVRSKEPGLFQTVQFYDDTHAPAWPDGSALQWTVQNGQQALQWTPATDLTGVAHYRIYQGALLLDTVPAAQTSYTLAGGAAPGALYRVEAGDGQGNWSTDGPTLSAVPSAGLSGAESVRQGQEFALEYSLGGVTGSVYAQQLTLVYDTSRIELLSAASVRSGVEIMPLDGGGNTPPGQARFIAYASDAGTAAAINGKLIRFNLRALPTAETVQTTVSIMDMWLADGEGHETALDDRSASLSIIHVNIGPLAAKIAEAQTMYGNAVEGPLPGQYPAGSKAQLQSAIAAAQAVADATSTTQPQADTATGNLQQAITAFQALANTLLVGDLNGDGQVRIGDLGIVAASYGKQSSDPDWALHARADLNGDGKVDLMDIVLVAIQL